MRFFYKEKAKMMYHIEEGLLELSVEDMVNKPLNDMVYNYEQYIDNAHQIPSVFIPLLQNELKKFYQTMDSLFNNSYELMDIRVKLLTALMQGSTLNKSVNLVVDGNDDFYLTGFYDCLNNKIVFTPGDNLKMILFSAYTTHKPLSEHLNAAQIRIPTGLIQTIAEVRQKKIW